MVTIIKLLEQEIQKKVKEVQSNSLHNAFFERILCNSLKRGGSSGAVKKKKRRKVYKIRLPGTFHNESKRRDSNTRPLRPELMYGQFRWWFLEVPKRIEKPLKSGHTRRFD